MLRVAYLHTPGQGSAMLWDAVTDDYAVDCVATATIPQSLIQQICEGAYDLVVVDYEPRPLDVVAALPGASCIRFLQRGEFVGLPTILHQLEYFDEFFQDDFFFDEDSSD